MTVLAERRTGASERARGELQYHHIAIAFLSAIAAFLLIEPLYKSLLQIYLSYNEGWNANHAVRAMQWQNLYAVANPLTENNYPPLSFYIVGGLGKLLGDNIFAGRVIAVLAFFATAANVGFAVFRICRNAPAAIFAAVFFVATMAGVYDMYIGVNDPQMLAHALMTTGLVVLLGAETRRRNLLLSAFFLCAGGFVKHNLVALPIAIAIYLLFCHRQSFYFWMACFAGFLTLALASTVAVFGFDFIANLQSPRRFTLFRLGKKMLYEPLKLQVPIVAWLIYCGVTSREKHTLLLGSYGLIALAAAIGFSGGDGVNVNVFFDLVIALSMTVGLALQHVDAALSDSAASAWTRLRVMTVLSLALCVGIVIHVPLKAFRLASILPELASIESDTRSDVAFLAGQPGPELCESLSLCYWAGKQFEVDAFLARQSFLAGRLDEAVLLDKVRSGYFDVIQLGSWDPDREDERMSPALLQTVHRCYRIDHVSTNGAFFTPGPDGCKQSAPADPDPSKRATGWLDPRRQPPARGPGSVVRGDRPVARG